MAAHTNTRRGKHLARVAGRNGARVPQGRVRVGGEEVTHTNGRPGRLKAILLGLVAATGAACSGGSSSEAPATTRQLSTYHTTDAGGAILLKDRLGNSIPVGSTTAYSPEKTCGTCHDVEVITEGYHFQQGKGFSNSDIRVADTYNPSKPWLLSDGMYGKW